jgi:hypothetical protein
VNVPADDLGNRSELIRPQRDATIAIAHEGPFGSLMPMQLTNSSCIQAHVDA